MTQALRMSNLFVRTMRNDPADEDIDSAKLLVRAGYLKKEAPGIFTWLPLGLRVLNKLENIIREEMATAGAQEVHLPALLPKEPYEVTHRWEEYGENIFKLKDRHGADYLLAPTHEEMFTLLAKNYYSSYKDLPVVLYQIQTKYRDEARPRAGLIRGREFIMKDAYSFTLDEDGLKQEYVKQRDAYERVYKRVGVKYVIVKSFSGPMGGSASEEFQAPLPIGEDTYALSPAGNTWNVEALSTPTPEPVDFSSTPAASEVEVGQAKSIDKMVEVANAQFAREDGREWAASDILKNVAVTLIHPADSEHKEAWREVVVVGVPGDREVDTKRLEAAFSPCEVEEASEEDLKKHPELVLGFIGPKALGPQARQAADGASDSAVRYFVDAHIARGSVWYTGADKNGVDYVNLVYGRDFEADGVVEALRVREGDMSPDGSGPLSFERGVEIGQVFQLGLKYTNALGFSVLNQNGKTQPVWMGSYGIGVSRTLACIAEFHHDEQGLAWPMSVAPAQVHVVIAGKGDELSAEAEKLVAELSRNGVEVLFDDREKVGAGVKFKDAELIGVPLIAVVGRGFSNDGTIEVRNRHTGESLQVPADQAAETLRKMVVEQLAELDAAAGE
ncbi:proline--tRNA ligase [Aeriscardovia aeriphila]|uniref:Proline--tRNA ligase n=1 Tax=Aeriscardovia aeriphila TaxID=218139 RepID=A0A261FBG6_9BIFI|nr:proline--tRNA ligase [Aeriscardovia aeriphila]NYI25538.1 prolyl-tRNA synthetase [Aeriscardovia aeriphila]OZG56313.1 proline--tRNA ligase [Aeriscardovia aeriphila]